uniref:SMC hinge domain-containing protein n=2 Tax=Dunaliella tertiolecta TaxID=3047 RepID=A0A7S3QU76_DUNTE
MDSLLQKLEQRPCGEAPSGAASARKSSTRHQAAAAAAAAAVQGGGGSSSSSSAAAAAAAAAEEEEAGFSWSPQPVLDSELRGTRRMLLTEAATIQQNVPNATTILGPVANLMACEREDVAYALSSLLGNKLLCYVTIKEDDCTALYTYLKEHYGVCKVLSLEAARVHSEPVDQSHPQQPLRIQPQPGAEQALNSDPTGMRFGFVGYAANLVHLSPALLQQPIYSGGGGGRGTSRQAMSLRQTLCSYFFQKIMVFEDSKGWLAFKAALKSTGYHLEPYTKLLGLDGTRANMSSGMLEADGTRGKDNRAAELQVCLGGVPLEAQKQAPLDARVQRIVTSVKELQDVHAKQQAALTSRAAADAALASAAVARDGVNRNLQPEVEQAQAELGNLQAELKRIQRAKDASAGTSAARARAGPASASAAGPGAGPSGRGANPARAQQLQDAQAILGQGLRSRGSHAHPGTAGGKRGGAGGEDGQNSGEGARKQPRRG